MRNFGRNTSLPSRSVSSYAKVVKVLLKATPTIELRNNDGQTEWSCSLDRQHHEFPDLLRRTGTDPNVKAPEEITRLYAAAAATAGDTNNVLFLLESAVNSSITIDYGWAPLHCVAHDG
ncbi:hypothetical protein HD806DRAFT_533190 [Xylariaceae sp. AK1471]|nr:hypothetical protein HD806DRAFT_533190 [Xylariaceae sp. AK1471]